MRGSYRTNFDEPRWRTIEARFMSEKKFSKLFDGVASVQLLDTKQNHEYTTFEIRPAIGARSHFSPESRIRTSMLARIEYRGILHQTTDVWTWSPRGRLKASANMPLNNDNLKGDNIFCLATDFELFFLVDDEVSEAFANRFWVMVSLGYRLNHSYSFEIMYNFQDSKNTIDSDFSADANII